MAHLLSRRQWLFMGLMALIVVGCAGSGGDQPAAPSLPTPTPKAVVPATPPPSPTLTSTMVAHSPHIVFQREAFDLGDVPVDKMSMVHFVYRNTGDVPLLVEEEPEVETLEGC